MAYQDGYLNAAFDPGHLFGNKPQTPTYGGAGTYTPPAYLTNLSGMVSGMSPPGQITAGQVKDNGMSDAYQAKDMSKSALPQFDTMRQQAQQSINQQASSNNDAMERRFAAMGNLNSGSYVKAGQIADQQTKEAQGNASTQIGQQEQAERQQLQHEQDQMAFSSGESAKGRSAQAQQYNASQQQAAEQFNTQIRQQAQQFGFDAASKIAAMEMQGQQNQEQNSIDLFNGQMASYTAQHSGGLFGGGGFLGTGLG